MGAGSPGNMKVETSDLQEELSILKIEKKNLHLVDVGHWNSILMVATNSIHVQYPSTKNGLRIGIQETVGNSRIISVENNLTLTPFKASRISPRNGLSLGRANGFDLQTLTWDVLDWKDVTVSTKQKDIPAFPVAIFGL